MDTIKIIVDEVLEYEKLNYSDIEFLESSALNYVVSIGNKVLKIGQERISFLIDNNKRFLKPILRTQITKVNSEEVLGCLEITEKVNTDYITEQEAYLICKELRDNGYYWTDCRECNLGKLIRKNKIYFDNLNPTKEVIYYKTDNEDELVIIDNDFIFTEEEFNKLPDKHKNDYLEEIEEFEGMYQEEKRRMK